MASSASEAVPPVLSTVASEARVPPPRVKRLLARGASEPELTDLPILPF